MENDLKGNENYFDLTGGSSYRGFELPGVDCIFKIIVAAYPRMRVSTSIYKAYKAYRISMCLKATEGRKAHKRDNFVSTYPALSGIQLPSGRVFCSYSKRFSLPQ